MVGRRRVQHWERSSCADPKTEDYGILREERKADWAAEENVSFENHWDERVKQVLWSQAVTGSGLNWTTHWLTNLGQVA